MAMLPPHNIIVEGRDDLSKDEPAVTGDIRKTLFFLTLVIITYCGPHQGVGMTGGSMEND